MLCVGLLDTSLDNSGYTAMEFFPGMTFHGIHAKGGKNTNW